MFVHPLDVMTPLRERPYTIDPGDSQDWLLQNIQLRGQQMETQLLWQQWALEQTTSSAMNSMVAAITPERAMSLSLSISPTSPMAYTPPPSPMSDVPALSSPMSDEELCAAALRESSEFDQSLMESHSCLSPVYSTTPPAKRLAPSKRHSILNSANLHHKPHDSPTSSKTKRRGRGTVPLDSIPECSVLPTLTLPMLKTDVASHGVDSPGSSSADGDAVAMLKRHSRIKSFEEWREELKLHGPEILTAL
jgi:hypothetical protein